MSNHGKLSPEERLAYDIAQRWNDSNYQPEIPPGMDWTRMAAILTHNRMAVLAAPILKEMRLPAEADGLLREQREKYTRAADRLGQALKTYLTVADERGLDTIVLKGLWLCEKIYHDPSTRPGGDIDILVRQAEVAASLDLLAEQGIGEFWPNLLDDEYFTRHHLHQQRCTPDLNVWFEIHWALDHPYTLLTVDYASIFDRSKRSTLLGATVREMAPPDLLLSLAIHLVKHAVYLPSLVDRDDLPRIILADGMLMYYVDIAEVIRQHRDFDWDQTVKLAREWGAVDILGSVLQTCASHLHAPIPEKVLSALPVSRPGPITRLLMSRAADEELADYEGREGSRFWKLLLASNGAFILRPIRMLETISYFLPPADFLERRYSDAVVLTRARHLLIALGQTIRFGWDTLYFGLERYFRLKRLGKSVSLFNRLETDL